MSTNSLEIVHEGWLTKSPPSKTLWRAKWRRRWFVLRESGELPGQFILEYFADRTCQKIKGKIDLDQCEQVDAGLAFNKGRHRFRYLFDLRTPKRVYYLAAETDPEMSKWVDCICQVCGLKAYTREDEYYDYVPTVDQTHHPQAVLDLDPISPSTIALPLETSHHPQTSSEPITVIPLTAISPSPPTTTEHHPPPVPRTPTPPRSPTESSVSGPYIPISECFTGASIFNKRNSSESYDLPRQLMPRGDGVKEEQPVISIIPGNPLPFVNWSTYPRENDPAAPPPEAPPRPPKPLHLKIEEDQSPPLSATLSEITDNSYDFPRQHHTLDRNQHCYSNAAPQPSLNGTVFRYDVPPHPDDTSSSLHSTPTPSPSPSTPPQVNRQLKPTRKASEGTNAASSPKEWGTIGSSQTLPSNWNKSRGPYVPPSVNRSLKPCKKDGQGAEVLRKSSRHNRAAPSPSPSLCQPPRRRRSEASSSEDDRRSLDMFNHQHPEIQYLDLDLENENISSIMQSPLRSPDRIVPNALSVSASSIVYRTVDFVKTEAFNRTRQDIVKERDARQQTDP